MEEGEPWFVAPAGLSGGSEPEDAYGRSGQTSADVEIRSCSRLPIVREACFPKVEGMGALTSASGFDRNASKGTRAHGRTWTVRCGNAPHGLNACRRSKASKVNVITRRTTRVGDLVDGSLVEELETVRVPRTGLETGPATEALAAVQRELLRETNEHRAPAGVTSVAHARFGGRSVGPDGGRWGRQTHSRVGRSGQNTGNGRLGTYPR